MRMLKMCGPALYKIFEIVCVSSLDCREMQEDLSWYFKGFQ